MGHSGAMIARRAMANTYKVEGRIPTMAENGCFYSYSDKKPPINVEGVVTAQDGEVLIGVNIQVKGTTQGTSTDFDGRFVLEDVAEDAVLVLSYVGYETQEVNVEGRDFITIRLLSDSQILDEVVVVAYGEVKRSDFTGSATTVTAKSLDKRPISNPLVALQGSGTGVQTTTPSGTPGASPTIRIRGIGSYSASSSALGVADGEEFRGGLANTNPDDV